MAVEVSLPRLGQGMEAGTIVRWLKSEGDQVEKGEALYELDTDKVTQEVEAEASGVLLKILAQEGAEIEVGKRIAVIGEQGEDVAVEVEEDSQEEGSGPAREEERERGRAASADDVPKPTEPARINGRVKASPLARRIARERGIDLRSLIGTGPDGRDRRRGRRTRRFDAGPRDRRNCAARGGGRAADVDPAHDRETADEGLGGTGFPDLDVGRT